MDVYIPKTTSSLTRLGLYESEPYGVTFNGSAAVPYQDYHAGYYGAYTTPLPIIMQRPPAPMLRPYVVKNAASVVSIVKFSDLKAMLRLLVTRR